jgi:hypothetical protein
MYESIAASGKGGNAFKIRVPCLVQKAVATEVSMAASVLQDRPSLAKTPSRRRLKTNVCRSDSQLRKAGKVSMSLRIIVYDTSARKGISGLFYLVGADNHARMDPTIPAFV